MASLFSFLRTWFATRKQYSTRPVRRRARRPLTLEILEDRSLPSSGNLAPVLPVLDDQAMSHVQDKLTLTVNAVDAEGDAVTYSAQVAGPAARAYQLDQALGLNFMGSYYTGYHGQNEKWLQARDGQFYGILPSGAVHHWLGTAAATFAAGGRVATLDATFHADPSKLWNAPVPPLVTVSANQLTIDPPAGYVGSFQVEVTASDGQASSTGTFAVTVTNAAPELSALADQTMKARQDTITQVVSASDADGDAVTVRAQVVGVAAQAYQLDQDLGLSFMGSYYTGYHGGGEKWLQARDGQFYCVLPNGEVHRWLGTAAATFSAAGRVATLDSSYHADPSLLWNAPATPRVTLAGDQLTIDPPVGYVGSFQVEVSASDGIVTTSQTFTVTVTNIAPVLPVIGDLTMRKTEDTITRAVSVSDGDGDPVTVRAQVVGVAARAYQLDQQLGLDFLGEQYTGYHGGNEKWLQARDGQFYCVLPNGEVHRWLGSAAATFSAAGLVTTLDAGYHADPTLLAKAPATPAVKLEGNQLTIDPPAGYVGSFQVELSASDGTVTVTHTFTVSVLNYAPVLNPLTDQTMPKTVDTIAQLVSASDADGDPLTVRVEVVSMAARAYQLDQDLGLSFMGDYFTGYHGGGEKWLQARDGQFYCVLPNGEVHRWMGDAAATFSTAGKVATFDASYYEQPEWLWQAPVAPYVHLDGNQLTIDPPSHYADTFQVQVSASDGLATVSQTFNVTVVNQVPVLSPLPDLTVPHTQDRILVALQASDADNDPLTFTAQVIGTTAKIPLTLSGNQLSIDPPPLFTGSFGVQVSASDGLATATRNFTVTVTNAAPVLNAIPDQTISHTQDKITLPLSAGDADGDNVIFSARILGPATGVVLTVAGNGLIIDPPNNYTGSFQVEVTASDRIASVSKTFLVTVTNQAPTLEPLSNQFRTPDQGPITLPLTAYDADGDPIAFSAQFTGPAATAWQLDQQLGLSYIGYFNYYGRNEYWMQARDGQFYSIVSTGAVHHWLGADGATFSAAGLVANLDWTYYVDPSMLYNAQPLPRVGIGGNYLAIDPLAFQGVVGVQYTASDGLTPTSRSFALTVAAVYPTGLDPDTGTVGDFLTRENEKLTLSGQGVAGTAFTVYVDGVVNTNAQVQANGGWSVMLVGTLSEKAHQIQLVPQNTTAKKSYLLLTVDRTPPQITLTSQLYRQGESARIDLKASDLNGIEYSHVNIDVDKNQDGDFADAGEALYYTGSIKSDNDAVWLAGLGLGDHKIRAHVFDRAGNEGISAPTLVIGPTATTAKLDMPTSTKESIYTATVTAVPGLRNGYQQDVTIEVDLNHDGQFSGPQETNFAAGTFNADGQASLRMHGLYYGAYQFRARLYDLAGEVVYSPVHTMTVPQPNPSSSMWFEPNLGQVLNNNAVQYFTRHGNLNFFVSPTEMAVTFAGPPTDTGANTLYFERVQLVGANANATATPLNGLSSYSTFYGMGRELPNIPNYRQVMYQNIYAGIDWQLGLHNGWPQYDFIINPGADLNALRLAYPEAQSLALDADGQLVITLDDKEQLLQAPPLAYQVAANGRIEALVSRYLLLGDRVGFEVVDYDPARKLIIDPYLYKTRLGGGGTDTPNGMALDGLGNIYVVGTTTDATSANKYPNLPVGAIVNPLITATLGGTSDVFITKLDPTGTVVLFSAFLGGDGEDRGNGIAVDLEGTIYVTGRADFNGGFHWTTPFFQPQANILSQVDGEEVFIAKLTTSGTLLYSKFLAVDNSLDEGLAIAVDSRGNAVVAGTTADPDAFPSAGGQNRTLGNTNTAGTDIFIAALDPTGNTLVYSRILGAPGTQTFRVGGMILDTLDQPHLVGQVSQAFTNVPNRNNFQGPTDGFVIKLGSSPDALANTDDSDDIQWLRYIGGINDTVNNVNFDDDARGIALDTEGNVYVAGTTNTYQPPVPGRFIIPRDPRRTTVGAFQDTDAVLTKLNSNGDYVYWSQTVESFEDEVGRGAGVDLAGNGYLYGQWNSADTNFGLFPRTQVNRIQDIVGSSQDAFLQQYDASGMQLLLSTTIGGSGTETPTTGGILVDVTNEIFLLGTTTDITSFPTPPANNSGGGLGAGGGTDVYVLKISSATPPSLGDDRFERNETSDEARFLGALTRNRPIAHAGLTTARHPDDFLFDYDWFHITVGQSGTLRVDLTHIRPFKTGVNETVGAGGDLHVRVFRLSGAVLEELGAGQGYKFNSGGQTVIAGVNADDLIFIGINPFNFTQAVYGLVVRLL